MNGRSASARRYRGLVCEHIYNPEQGGPESGIAPCTPYEDLPDTWACPECGASQQDFERVED
jgi:rubredoxin